MKDSAARGLRVVGVARATWRTIAATLLCLGRGAKLAAALTLFVALGCSGSGKNSSAVGLPPPVAAPGAPAPSPLASGRAEGTRLAASAPSMTAPVPAPVAKGPTPFPADHDAWPGKGVIVVFPYMNDNRKWFWHEREKQQQRIVFAGDSLVGGWKTLAEDLAGFPVVNRAIGGEPTRGLLFRFQEDVLDLHPEAIVLLTGTNDLSAQQDVRAMSSNITEMLDMVERRSPGIPVVLCTLPPRNYPKAPVDAKQLLAANALIRGLSQGRERVVVLDLYALLADPDGSPHPEYFAADQLHLAEPGFQRFRDGLVPLLKRFHLG